jgi:hypothetical protein
LEERRPLARAPAGSDRGGSLVCGDDDEPVDVAASDFGKDCNAELSSHPSAADTRSPTAAPWEARIRVDLGPLMKPHELTSCVGPTGGTDCQEFGAVDARTSSRVATSVLDTGLG